MTYANLVHRGVFCKCALRSTQKRDFDTWKEWLLCNQCRLPIKGSNHGATGDGPQIKE